MKDLFSVGDRIGGFCNGYFGRDDYDDKVCVFVNNTFAVFQNDDGVGSVINKEDGLTIETVEGWKECI